MKAPPSEGRREIGRKTATGTATNSRSAQDPQEPKRKHYFAAIPARAFFDRRLDGGRFQLLGAIALSNRLGQGQGCWRSADTLATMTGLDPGTIRNYLSELVNWAYVTREPRPGTKTQRSLFVNYDDRADREALMRNKASSANDTSPTKVSSGDAQSVISRDDTSKSIEREIALSAREQNSAEAAPHSKCVANDVHLAKIDQEFLRRLQSLLPSYTNGWPLSRAKLKTLQRWLARCDQIIDENGTDGDPIGGWAYRLSEELSWILTEHGVSHYAE